MEDSPDVPGPYKLLSKVLKRQGREAEGRTYLARYEELAALEENATATTGQR
jgi:hypothetical protein